MNAVADAFALTFANEVLPARSLMAREDRELDARRTGIQDEDSVTHGFAPLVTRQQQRDRAGPQPCQRPVGAACQNDRHARAEHDAGHLRFREILELLRQHVAGLEVRHHEDVGTAGDRRDDPLGLGRLRRDRIVEGERTIENAAGDLASIGHLAKCRRIEGGLDFFRDVSTADRIATRGSGIPSACARSIAFWMMSRLSASVG